MIVPYQFNLAPPTPEGTPHVLSKPLTFETVHVGPKVAPVARDADVGNVAEVLLVIVVSVRLVVWLL